MRILIADETVATSEALRNYFRAPEGSATQVALSVTCACPKTADDTPNECACGTLDLDDQPELQAAILDALGLALLNRGCLDEGGPLIEKAREIRRDFFGTEHPAYAASQNSYARLRRERSDYKTAEVAVQDALRINRGAFGAKSLPVALSLYQLGANQLDQGRFEAAYATALEGLEIMGNLGPAANDPNLTRLLDIRGRAELNLGKVPQAVTTYTELLDLDLKELGTREHLKYYTHLANFGMVKEIQGDKCQAEDAYRAAIEFIVERLKRPCHPILIDIYANLGSLLRERGNEAEKKEIGAYFEKALKLARRVRGNDHVLVANDHANLGRWQYDSRDTAGALTQFGRAIDIYEQNVKEAELPAEHFFLAEARAWKGRVLVESNTIEFASEAQPLLELAVAHYPAQLGPGSRGEGMAKACLGYALLVQGKERERGCQLLGDGYAILKEKSSEEAFIARVEGWLDQYGCRKSNC